MTDQIISIAAVVVGAILGYLASFLNNSQQRKWQLNNDYRNWKRDQIKKDFDVLKPLILKYNTLAHAYVEYCENPKSDLLKELLNERRNYVKQFLRVDIGPFPVRLKSESTKTLLEELDNVTDEIEAIGMYESESLHLEAMRSCLERIRNVERQLESEYDIMIEKTFN